MLSPIFFAMMPICIGLAPLQEATPWSIVQSQHLSGDRIFAADDRHQLIRLRPIRTSAVSPRCPEVRFEEIFRKAVSEDSDGGTVLLYWFPDGSGVEGRTGQERVVFRRDSKPAEALQ